MYRCDYYLKGENTLPDSEKSCWNHVQIDFEQVRCKVTGWLVEILDRECDLRKVVIDSAWQEFSRTMARQCHMGSQVHQRIAELEKQGNRLAHAISTGGKIEFLVTQFKSVNEPSAPG